MSPSLLVRGARLAAGLTQTELAARAGITQAQVARLEQPGANPTLHTVQRVLTATGHRLSVVQAADEADSTQIAERLALSPAERLATFSRSQKNLSRLARSARRVAA